MSQLVLYEYDLKPEGSRAKGIFEARKVQKNSLGDKNKRKIFFKYLTKRDITRRRTQRSPTSYYDEQSEEYKRERVWMNVFRG